MDIFQYYFIHIFIFKYNKASQNTSKKVRNHEASRLRYIKQALIIQGESDNAYQMYSENRVKLDTSF